MPPRKPVIKFRLPAVPARLMRWLVLLAMSIVFTATVYPGLYVSFHGYQLGDVADRNIKAPRDFLLENPAATEAARQQAVEDIRTVYDHDVRLGERIQKQVAHAFSPLQAAAARWEAQGKTPDTVQVLETPRRTGIPPARPPFSRQVEPLRAGFEKALGFEISDGAYKLLEKERFSSEIVEQVSALLDAALAPGVVANKTLLLRETLRGIALRDVETQNEQVIAKLDSYASLDQARTVIRTQGLQHLKNVDYNLRNLIIDFAQALLRPNITLNRNETTARRKKAALEVNPVLTQIKAGEMLLREGERVSAAQLVRLNAFQTHETGSRSLALALAGGFQMLCLLIVIHALLAHHFPTTFDDTRNLLLILTIFIISLAIIRITPAISKAVMDAMPFGAPHTSVWYAAPVAAGAMLVCLFLQIEMAAAFAFPVALAAAIILNQRFDLFFYFYISAVLGALSVSRCRERKVFIKAGLRIGLINVLLATAGTLYMGEYTVPQLAVNWLFAFLGGLGAGIVTAGLAPLIEFSFNYTTDIKLLELANLDQPILRQLMIEAPGTYHHCMVVGSMVEAAASEIGANSLLAKVCGYYHDIGKIKKPHYFIENQRGGPNPHDKLAPSMSALILISHVKNGVEIARQHKLGQPIIDTIQQHHGNSIIRYFYEKAKDRNSESIPNINDFRYPGPSPQSRETGLVMLADVSEAASRTLENPTPARIQGLVQNLINKIFSDGQLDSCELTLQDLHKIARSFHKTLNAIHHHRIEYPEKKPANGKAKDGNPDRQPSKKTPAAAAQDRDDRPGHLRRLGLS